MRIKPETEKQVTILDPAGPLAWLGEFLVGRAARVKEQFVMIKFVGNVAVYELWPDSISPASIFKDGSMAEEIVSPDGKKVAVRLCVDVPTPTHLFLYDTDE